MLYTGSGRPAHFRNLQAMKVGRMGRKYLGALIGWLLAGHAAASSPLLRLEDCQLESTVTRGSAEARCGWFEVAENRDDKAGKRIRIHVAVLPAFRKQPLNDPLFIISGGPGQAASDFYLSSAVAFDRLRTDRDLVIVDQRGTGKSQFLQCKLPDEIEMAHVNKEVVQRYTRQCLNDLVGDPRYYTTSVAVRDLDDIRQALGYDKINLYSVSYGTRVAQHYARRYPHRLRSMVLDGVVPVELALGPAIAIHAQQALDTILRRCEADTDCGAAFPKLADKFAILRGELAAHAVPISIADPRTSKRIEMEFGVGHLAVALRLLSYSDDTASLLPFLIDEAAQHRPQAMAAQALLVARSLKDQMALGMQYAVICTEDMPFIAEASRNDPTIAASYMGRMFLDTLGATCEVWPRGNIDSDFHAPLHSDVPALLLSGDNDPVTPAAFGEQAARGLTQSKHVVFAGQGHGQLQSRCGASLIRRFVESGSAKNLDVSCVAQVMPTPFIIDANGPKP